MVEPFPESFDASVSAWQWPGAYPYAAADSAYTNFLACLKALYIGVSILILFKLRESRLLPLLTSKPELKVLTNANPMKLCNDKLKYIFILVSFFFRLVNKGLWTHSIAMPKPHNRFYFLPTLLYTSISYSERIILS